MNPKAFLVVGGDSLVGKELVHALESRGESPVATTRRPNTTNEKRIFLDFTDESSFPVAGTFDHAIIVAAATNYGRCETDPLAREINLEYTPRLVASLLRGGTFVTFISTNSVFGGETPWPTEDSPHAPAIAYAQQKSEAERRMRLIVEEQQAHSRFSVVRLTKVLDKETPPLPSWLAAWSKGETVEPFSDLIFAPISVQYAGRSLANLATQFLAGNLHLSGKENIGYDVFARLLALKLGVSPKLIQPTTATAKGVHIPFKPIYSGIDMQRTQQLSEVAPQSAEEVVTDILLQLNKGSGA